MDGLGLLALDVRLWRQQWVSGEKSAFAARKACRRAGQQPPMSEFGLLLPVVTHSRTPLASKLLGVEVPR
jgi:hypothetical protein